MDAGKLLGRGVADAGEEAGGDSLGAERVMLELQLVAFPSPLRDLAHFSIFGGYFGKFFLIFFDSLIWDILGFGATI